jgi:hypothetical protein
VRTELLNNYVYSVCIHDDGKTADFICAKRTVDTYIDGITFDCTSIQRAIAKPKTNLAGGIDGFPPLLVKKLAPSQLQPLSLLYTSFLSLGKTPDAWHLSIKVGQQMTCQTIDQKH